MSYMNTDEMLGEVDEQETTDGKVVVTAEDGRYCAGFNGHTAMGDCLNVNGSAAGMSHNSVWELGGDREKRVTKTVLPSGSEYIYVETRQ